MTNMTAKAQQPSRIGNLCYVYAKTKWMHSFKAFDLDGLFPGNLIYASLIDDSEENRQKLQRLADDNRNGEWQFQLRKDDKVLFQTELAA